MRRPGPDRVFSVVLFSGLPAGEQAGLAAAPADQGRLRLNIQAEIEIVDGDLIVFELPDMQGRGLPLKI